MAIFFFAIDPFYKVPWGYTFEQLYELMWQRMGRLFEYASAMMREVWTLLPLQPTLEVLLPYSTEELQRDKEVLENGGMAGLGAKYEKLLWFITTRDPKELALCTAQLIQRELEARQWV